MKKLNINTATSFAISILILCLPFNSYSQLGGVENGQWRYLGGDAGHTRAAPQLDQINSSNFADLEVAWIWRGNNFSASEEYTFRSTPIFVDGILYTVVGQRRQLVAIEAATGETLWTFREPETMRYLRSPRTDLGKVLPMQKLMVKGLSFSHHPHSSSGHWMQTRGAL